MSQAIAAELSASDRPKRTSELLAHLAASHKAGRISVGHIIEGLGNRSFGVLLVAFAIPNLPPLGIPGLSTVCAVPIIYLALQMLAGKPAPALPKWLHSRNIATPSFRRLVEATTPFLRRIERLLSPRITALTSPAGEIIIGATVLLLACILVFPIPFGNLLPALSIAILALAMIEKDGVAVLAGLAVTTASVLVVAIIAVGSIELALAGWGFSLDESDMQLPVTLDDIVGIVLACSGMAMTASGPTFSQKMEPYLRQWGVFVAVAGILSIVLRDDVARDWSADAPVR